jgi:GNAT superfamily N-acetyltransferase
MPKSAVGHTLTRLVTVRLMQTREDASAIVDMAQELAIAVDDPKPSTTAEALLRDGLGPARWFDCWLAENELEPIGYALACRGFEAHTGKRRLWLGDLYVRPSARHIGAGRALVAAVVRHALALGCDAVYWELWRQNVGGGAFYQQLAAEELRDLAIMRLDPQQLAAIADQL